MIFRICTNLKIGANMMNHKNMVFWQAVFKISPSNKKVSTIKITIKMFEKPLDCLDPTLRWAVRRTNTSNVNFGTIVCSRFELDPTMLKISRWFRQQKKMLNNFSLPTAESQALLILTRININFTKLQQRKLASKYIQMANKLARRR